MDKCEKLISTEELDVQEKRKDILFGALNITKMHPLEAIIILTKEFGWDIALPHTESPDDTIPGISIGSEEYLKSLK